MNDKKFVLVEISYSYGGGSRTSTRFVCPKSQVAKRVENEAMLHLLEPIKNLKSMPLKPGKDDSLWDWHKIFDFHVETTQWVGIYGEEDKVPSLNNARELSKF
jgi:hypothetical protein